MNIEELAIFGDVELVVHQVNNLLLQENPPVDR
jgi:hypothetical protein